MILKLLKLVCVSALLIIIHGCAGTSFKWDDARKIKEGMTTDQLTRLMGQPYVVRVDEEGKQLWQWVYVDLYSVAGGTRTLNISMRDGKVIKAPVIPDSFK